jgi:hypothetical protein
MVVRVPLGAKQHPNRNHGASPTDSTQRIENQEAKVRYSSASRQCRGNGRESWDELCRRQRERSPSIEGRVDLLEAKSPKKGDRTQEFQHAIAIHPARYVPNRVCDYGCSHR